jgi:hypothetical protein
LTLSTILPGCAHRTTEQRPPLAIAVETRTAPPAELLLCPERPEGFALDEPAVLPQGVRLALIRLARAFATNADRQERLIAWAQGKPCDAAEPPLPDSAP